jgi:branched-chain amino acid transport system substrate-binding protein
MADNRKVWIIILIVAIVLLIGINVATFSGITGNVVSTETGGDGEDDGIVKFGWMGPLTGDAASYGESIKKGVEMALEDSGLDLEIVYEDSKCEATAAVTVVNKLVSIDGVDAIVGEVCSGATLAAAPIAEQNKVVLISSSSTSPDITNAGDYIFRTVPSDALQGVFAAQLIHSRGNARIGILYPNEDYGLGLKNVLEKAFEDRGGEDVATEAFEKGSSDLRTQLIKLNAGGPDAIYVISNSPDSAVAALRQIEELGINADIYGSEGLRGPEVSKLGSAEGLVITSVSSGTTEFSRKHEEKFGEAPGPFAAQAYDAMTALAIAIEGGASTGEEIKDALSGMTFEGASGSIEFDENGDVFGNYDVLVLRGGEFVAEG